MRWRFLIRLPRFNPTLIRLRHEQAVQGIRSVPWFQSHIDSIKAFRKLGIRTHKISFNPTLIRLRHLPTTYYTSYGTFQSHIDSIKAGDEHTLDSRMGEVSIPH